MLRRVARAPGHAERTEDDPPPPVGVCAPLETARNLKTSIDHAGCLRPTIAPAARRSIDDATRRCAAWFAARRGAASISSGASFQELLELDRVLLRLVLVAVVEEH